MNAKDDVVEFSLRAQCHAIIDRDHNFRVEKFCAGGDAAQVGITLSKYNDIVEHEVKHMSIKIAQKRKEFSQAHAVSSLLEDEFSKRIHDLKTHYSTLIAKIRTDTFTLHETLKNDENSKKSITGTEASQNASSSSISQDAPKETMDRFGNEAEIMRRKMESVLDRHARIFTGAPSHTKPLTWAGKVKRRAEKCEQLNHENRHAYVESIESDLTRLYKLRSEINVWMRGIINKGDTWLYSTLGEVEERYEELVQDVLKNIEEVDAMAQRLRNKARQNAQLDWTSRRSRLRRSSLEISGFGDVHKNPYDDIGLLCIDNEVVGTETSTASVSTSTPQTFGIEGKMGKSAQTKHPSSSPSKGGIHRRESSGVVGSGRSGGKQRHRVSLSVLSGSDPALQRRTSVQARRSSTTAVNTMSTAASRRMSATLTHMSAAASTKSSTEVGGDHLTMTSCMSPNSALDKALMQHRELTFASQRGAEEEDETDPRYVNAVQRIISAHPVSNDSVMLGTWTSRFCARNSVSERDTLDALQYILCGRSDRNIKTAASSVFESVNDIDMTSIQGGLRDEEEEELRALQAEEAEELALDREAEIMDTDALGDSRRSDGTELDTSLSPTRW